MHWQSTPYELPLVAAALLCACIAAYAWRHRPAPGTRALVTLLSATGIWSLAYALELASVTLHAKLFWENVTYIGVEMVPLAWLAFALEYTGREQGFTPRRLALVATEPLLVLAVLFLGDPFHLMRASVHLGTVGAYTVLVTRFGPLFWINVAYSYCVVLVGAALLWPLLEGLAHPNPYYRGQAAMLLISVLAPWVANVLSITGLSPVRGLDLTPFAFTIGGAALGWSVLRYRLLDVIPVARDALIESMGDAVLVLDARGRVVDLNPAARRLLDRSSAAVMGRPIASLIPEGNRALWPALGAGAEPAGTTPDAGERSEERHGEERHGIDSREQSRVSARGERSPWPRTELMLGSGAAARWYDVRVSPLRDPAGAATGHLVVLDDITARVQAETALRDSEERARMIFEQAPIGMALLDLEHRFLRVNRAMCEMLGYSERELAATKLEALAHPDDAGKSALLDAQAVRGALTSYQMELRYVKKSRETLWAQLTMTVIRADGLPAYRLAMIENIYERKRAELLEDEKRHMAYELHDGLAQITAGAHLHLQAFAGRFRPRSPEARAELERALALAQRAARESRHVIAGLRPTVVEELGLATALRMHVESLRSEKWDVTYEDGLNGARLPVAMETALFRVAMESLNNVRKHAKSTRVRVGLERGEDSVTLEVRDWGRGFDPDAPLSDDRVGHIGLHEMRDRIALLGGRLEIESQIGEGTRVRAVVPAPAAPDAGGGDPTTGSVEPAAERTDTEGAGVAAGAIVRLWRREQTPTAGRAEADDVRGTATASETSGAAGFAAGPPGDPAPAQSIQMAANGMSADDATEATWRGEQHG